MWLGKISINQLNLSNIRLVTTYVQKKKSLKTTTLERQRQVAACAFFEKTENGCINCYCVRGTRTQPLICVGCSVKSIRDVFFENAFV